MELNINSYYFYGIAFSLLAVGSFLFVENPQEYFALAIALSAILFNHYALVRGGKALVNQKGRSLLYFIGKFFALAFGLLTSVHLMPNKVILPFIIYIISLFILAMSMVIAVKSEGRLTHEN